ncbi:type IV pilin protein [Acinetobacter indicus]|uniref:type IV pilin protein n=1 Tax=Acinetobacter indicus TaxID=756892 RepID=UPI000CEC46F6|nr:prepilin-type N-terminal cleavage/methylation domain-containing protein [Acinetobacter indicus]
MIQNNQGFTLIELMIAVIVVSILTAIAVPSYQVYVRKATDSNVQQEIQKLTQELEQHKSRQFNYIGYAPSANPLYLPAGSTSATAKYKIEIADGDETSKKLDQTTSPPKGRNWVIRATSSDNRLYSYLIDSKGTKCKNKTAANVTMTSCGTGGEPWK